MFEDFSIKGEEVEAPSQLTRRTLVMGPVASGKSTYAATWVGANKEILEELGRVPRGLVLCSDMNVSPYEGEPYDIINLNPLDYPKLMKIKMDLEAQRKKTEIFPWSLIVVDSMTSLQEIYMNHALAINTKRDEAGGPIGKLHYTMVKNEVKSLLAVLRTLPCALILVAHSKLVLSDAGTSDTIVPNLVGALANDVPSMMDEIYHAIIKPGLKGSSFALLTRTRGKFVARSGISGVRGRLAEEMPNNHKEFVRMIKNQTNVEETK